MDETPIEGAQMVIESAALQQLMNVVIAKGYRLIGPTIRDNAIVLDDIASMDDLPIGWTSEQDGGTYRLTQRKDQAIFGFAVSQHSWKNFLFPSVQRLWTADRDDGHFNVNPDLEDAPPLALFGVRPCDLTAIKVQDKVFMEGKFIDAHYQKRRKNALVIVVNCSTPGGTCFCTSMSTGPRAESDFDLALTEAIEAGNHYFIIQVGSALGGEILEGVAKRPAHKEEKEKAEQITSEAAGKMGRTMNTNEIKALLYRNYENPRWEIVARRCLTCTNCTLVCPTCFCATIEDTTDLSGKHATRWRKLDSCYTLDFSYIHGGSVRASDSSRYRQWLTHKLATWIDQFGCSGCVGCGRCITWCPVGIDITEEVQAIRETDHGG